MTAEKLARWLCASGEFSNREGPYLDLLLQGPSDLEDLWVLTQDTPPVSPKDLAEAILEFLL
jgi:hypothetical protein